ncbi:MAG TPA: hypothetical protein VFK02_00890 [Kofleriaceae bacterium]|nr:hypothetical protein [Kofleriaceae bacterium]
MPAGPVRTTISRALGVGQLEHITAARHAPRIARTEPGTAARAGAGS